MKIRQAAVSGLFYSDEPDILKMSVQRMMSDVDTSSPSKTPRAIIAPHAGYIYSGPIAATAYASLNQVKKSIKRVILLGPSHRVPLSGIATPGCDTFASPLGIVPLDTGLMAELNFCPQVHENPEAHAMEHSLEVQLPFLQTCLESFTLVPLVIGEIQPEIMAEVLGRIWKDDETLLVVSSDLSHYLPYEQAQTKDHDTSQAIQQLDNQLRGDQACGCRPLNGLLSYCKEMGLEINTLDLRNSGDTAGDKARVVGYGAYVVH